MKSTKPISHPIIAIGSGNIENIIELKGEMLIGEKHQVYTHEYLGGSCVNYSLRLMSMGEHVFPIPLIGKDRLGIRIQNALFEIGHEKSLPETILDFIRCDDFLIRGIKTPQSTIIVQKGKRTIFSQRLSGSKSIVNHVERRLDQVDTLLPTNKGSVMIGHITTDGYGKSRGLITKKIVDGFRKRFLIFGNFGNSQLQLGIDAWITYLKRIDLLQLNLAEMRHLFKQQPGVQSLFDILRWFKRQSITAVITLNRFGAIGTYKKGKNGLILAWPLDVGTVADTTGAGDAFAAGMISKLRGNKEYSFNDFSEAIRVGRLWASIACTAIGASNNCPDREDLETYRKKYASHSETSVEIIDINHSKRIINLLDKANS